MVRVKRNYRPPPHCTCGKCNEPCLQHVELQKRDYVFHFLNGLNDSYSAMRSQIVLMKPFPSIDEAYNIVLREESQRNFQFQAQPFVESSALAAFMANGKNKSNLM